MHEMMDELGQRNIKLTLNKNTQKVKVKLDGGAFIEFRAELAAMLGFVGKGPEKLVSVRHLNTHDAELPIDLNAGMYSLYLYSDIVEDQLIGDVSLETSLICILLSASRDVHFNKRMMCYLSGLL